jgi:hypothetical protein
LPPLPPDDPRAGLDLNRPGYRDNFETRFTWGEQSHSGALTTWEGGRLKAVDLLADANVWWTTTGPNAIAGDFYAEVSATIGECSERDASGFAVRVDISSGYVLEVSCDGAYRLRKFTLGNVTVLRDWTNAEAIVQGSGAMNRLGILADGTSLYAFANNTRLGEVLEDTSHFAGSFGLYAMGQETPGLTVYFDDFELWYVTH